MFSVSTKAIKKEVTTETTRSKWILHIPRYGRICVTCSLHKAEKCSIIAEGQVENRYLQSGSVHIPGQFSSPSTGYHEHFIGIHLQEETFISGQVRFTSF